MTIRDKPARRKWNLKSSPQPTLRFVRRFRLPGPLLDPGNDPAHRSSWALRMVRRLPVVIVNAPERVVLNAAFILVGVAALFVTTQNALLASWPEWVRYAFAMAMTGGGAAVLLGMFRGLTSIERLGYVLVSPACLLFAISSVVVRGAAGVPVFLIFVGIAAAKTIRLVISSAERDMTIEYGERLDREVASQKPEAPS